MPCTCGENEIKCKICYNCGYDIEYGTEIVIDGKEYHKRCVHSLEVKIKLLP